MKWSTKCWLLYKASFEREKLADVSFSFFLRELDAITIFRHRSGAAIKRTELNILDEVIELVDFVIFNKKSKHYINFWGKENV